MARRRTTLPQAQYDPRTVRQRIVDTPLKKEMNTSFLAYAYSVIYSRALPDARDGLKPVQRRILYQMGEMRLTPDKPYMKSARAVGEVMGKLHPHGDSSIYEAMVRLAQPFAMRLPLVDGHGNFGSLDDGPAASRYTEARLAPAALAMNADVHEGTVPFSPNYDNKLKEPDVLPAAIPNLLVNGSQGIAVGMATNMITHNLGEVIAAAKYLIAHPQASLDDLIRLVPGPDMPGGGIIMGRQGIREAYSTGRGTFTTRARARVENVTARRKGIVITELPFMVGPERVLERIGQAVKEKKLDGIASAVDLSDRLNGLKMVITIKSGFDPAAVLRQLYLTTPLESTFAINNVALVDGRPHTMGLKELLQVWIDHRRSVVHNRSQFRKKKAQERLHLVEGLLLALVDIDEVIQVIRSSDDQASAKQRLMAVFDLDDVQATYILDLQLRRLTKMSRIELEGERDDLKRQIRELDLILSSPAERDRVVVTEMDEAAAKYGDARRTQIFEEDGTCVAQPGSVAGDGTAAGSGTAQAGQDGGRTLPGAGMTAGMTRAGVSGAQARDLSTIDVSGSAAQNAQEGLRLEDEPCAVILGASGLIARTGVSALDLLAARTASTPRAAQDAVASAFSTTTLSDYGLITSSGRLVRAHAADLPRLSVSEDVNVAGGVRADELLAAAKDTQPVPGERVVAAVALPAEVSPGTSDDTKTTKTDGNDPGPTPFVPVAMATRSGLVRRWNGDMPTTHDSFQILILRNLPDGQSDTIVGAAPARDEDRLVLISSDAKILTFAASAVRPQGRSSAGMKGIRLSAGAHVAGFAVVHAGDVGWTDADGGSGAVVLTIAGDGKALAGTESGSAKLTPLDVYPTKRRGTGGVRVQAFLKGQNEILLAAAGPFPLHALNGSGNPVRLPDVDKRRDASGTPLSSPVAFIG